ncbi:MAG: alpha-xylosidase [Anaerolineae bacterium]
MKFSDGYWLMRSDVQAYYPSHVHDVEVRGEALEVYGAFKRVQRRGDTTDIGMLTVRLSSPMTNVIHVEMYHHKGAVQQGPAFRLTPGAVPEIAICDGHQAATLTSGDLTVRVDKGPAWRIDFMDGERVLTGSGWRGMGVIDTDDGERYIHEQLNLSVGECVYGLGERFTPFVKNGQAVDLWNEDGGTASEQAYKNVPFYLTNRGYGVFINHPERVSLEIASERVERVQFSVPGERLDYYLINGPTPMEVLERYTALTGRPALPPAWSFGLWLSTSFTTNYDEGTVTEFVQGMADRGIPLSVFHFDCFWMREFHWCDMTWDRRVFPDPVGMLCRLKERGLHVCLWINPYIAQRSPMFDEGMANGYLVKRADGSVWQWDRWQAGMGLVDFTNPAACDWYSSRLKALMDMGVDTFKTDFGERILTDVVWADGSDPLKMHNYYTQLYNQTVFELLERTRCKGEAVVFARSATTGGQQFPVHWGGDCSATFESMAESLRGGLSLTSCGFGFWSHDIGGFEMTASADVYKRWCAFGLLSSHSRLHGNESYRVPWLYDEEAVDVLRAFTRLKNRLMPYLYGAAVTAHERGIPVMRAMPVAFPDDRGCDTLDRQYMLGDALLVAPVFSQNKSVDYYLPLGRWTNLLDGRVVEGGRWVHESHGFMSLPLMVRPGSLIPMGQNEERPDYNYAPGVTLHLFELADGMSAQATVPAVTGATALTARAERSGDKVIVSVAGDASDWRVLLRGVDGVTRVAGGTAREEPQGTLIVPEQGVSRVEVSL